MSANPPTGAERRKHPRIPVAARVTLVEDTEEDKFYFIKDLSRGGMFLQTHEPFPRLTRLTCEIAVESLPVIKVSGRVVRQVTEPESDAGNGVEFVDVSPDAAVLLEQACAPA